MDTLNFGQFVDLLRGRIGAADAIEGNHELHSFRELMADYADVTPDKWYRDAFKDLDAQRHLSPTSRVAKGGDAKGRLSGRRAPLPRRGRRRRVGGVSGVRTLVQASEMASLYFRK